MHACSAGVQLYMCLGVWGCDQLWWQSFSCSTVSFNHWKLNWQIVIIFLVTRRTRTLTYISPPSFLNIFGNVIKVLLHLTSWHCVYIQWRWCGCCGHSAFTNGASMMSGEVKTVSVASKSLHWVWQKDTINGSIDHTIFSYCIRIRIM